jgi:hypothetical protein
LPPRFPSPAEAGADLVVRQSRIVVPNAAPFDTETWAESVFGNIVRPLVEEERGLQWFWFSRYAHPRSGSGDRGTVRIPRSFAQNGLIRSVRFRYAFAADDAEAFERRAAGLSEETGSRVTDVGEYDWLADLGGERFAGTASPERRATRARLVAELLGALCRVTLDCLSGPDELGRYRIEENLSRSNPHGSPFESLHHLFCNITVVPTSVLVSGEHIGTHWTPPPDGGPMHEKTVRY